MPIRMEGMTELPELKSEIKAEDFVSSHDSSASPISQQQSPGQQQIQNNCNWVGKYTF